MSNWARCDALAVNNSQSTADFDECGLLFIQLVKLCWISVVNLFDIFFKRFILDLTFVSHATAALYQQWCIWRHKSNSRFLFELSLLNVVSFGAKFYKSMRGQRAWRMTVCKCWWLAVLHQVKTLLCWLNTQTLWIEASKTISPSVFLHIVKRMQETCRNNRQSEW